MSHGCRHQSRCQLRSTQPAQNHLKWPATVSTEPIEVDEIYAKSLKVNPLPFEERMWPQKHTFVKPMKTYLHPFGVPSACLAACLCAHKFRIPRHIWHRVRHWHCAHRDTKNAINRHDRISGYANSIHRQMPMPTEDQQFKSEASSRHQQQKHAKHKRLEEN